MAFKVLLQRLKEPMQTPPPDVVVRFGATQVDQSRKGTSGIAPRIRDAKRRFKKLRASGAARSSIASRTKYCTPLLLVKGTMTRLAVVLAEEPSLPARRNDEPFIRQKLDEVTGEPLSRASLTVGDHRQSGVSLLAEVENCAGILNPIPVRRLDLGERGAARASHEQTRNQFRRHQNVLVARTQISLPVFETQVGSNFGGENTVLGREKSIHAINADRQRKLGRIGGSAFQGSPSLPHPASNPARTNG